LGAQQARLSSGILAGKEVYRSDGTRTEAVSGTVVRIEPDGLELLNSTQKVGANNPWRISTTISSTLPFRGMKPGVHVSGLAEVSDRDLAAVKTIELD